MSQVSMSSSRSFYSRTAPVLVPAILMAVHLRPCNGWGWRCTAVYPDVSRKEFPEVPRLLDTPPAGDSINSKGLWGEVIGHPPFHLSSHEGWDWSRCPSSLCGHESPHHLLFSDSRQHADSRLTPRRGPILSWQFCHAAHLSLTVVHHMRAAPSRGG